MCSNHIIPTFILFLVSFFTLTFNTFKHKIKIANFYLQFTCLAKLVDAADSKSVLILDVGSSPTISNIFYLNKINSFTI